MQILNVNFLHFYRPGAVGKNTTTGPLTGIGPTQE